MGEYRMPSLGADMERGIVAHWLVGPGDRVHRGDVVAAIDTEKATIDAEVFEDGVVERLLVAEGEEVPVGTPLAVIAPVGEAFRVPPEVPPTPARPSVPKPGTAPLRAGVPGEHLHSPLVRRLASSLGVDLAGLAGSGPGGEITRADVEAAAARAVPTRPAPPPLAPVTVPAPEPRPVPAPTAGHARAAPYVRRRARELGVDLQGVTGTGPGGVVTLADLERPEAPAPTRPAARRRPRTAAEQREAMRERTAALMARSKREIPHYYLTSTIEVGALLGFLAEQNADRPPERRVLPVAALLKATALAAGEVPEMNGCYLEGAFRPSKAVHLGVAIALRQGGLVAPVIRDLEQLGLDEVMATMRDLVGRARAGRLRSSEVGEATLTVTSLGDLGVDAVLGVIYPPQVALVGFGTIMQRPWAVEGLVGARPTVTASLAGDHRVSDGHLGARFLRALARLLHDVEGL